MAKSIRTGKVGSLIKEELSTMFQRNFSMAEYGFLTVTEVIMSPDLKVAKVYISIFGDEERKKKSFTKLESQKASIRSMLARKIQLKFAPEIIFYLDQTLDNVIKLENIFNEIHSQEAQNKERQDLS